jgi:hypothetical protein
MDSPSFYITHSNFSKLIGANGYWQINDLPSDRANQIRPFLANQETLGVFVSGIAPQRIEQTADVVGGIDWIRIETNRRSNEPPLNVYHYVIMRPDAYGYPVFACRNGSIAPHWSELEDLEVYDTDQNS